MTRGVDCACQGGWMCPDCQSSLTDTLITYREALEKIASWAMKPNRQEWEERDEAIEIARVALDT